MLGIACIATPEEGRYADNGIGFHSHKHRAQLVKTDPMCELVTQIEGNTNNKCQSNLVGRAHPMGL